MAATAAVACTLGASSAEAVQQPAGITPGLQLTSGATGRPVRHVTSRPPARATRAWRAFRSKHPGRWVGSWDAATGVAHRIFGEGIDAPGAGAHPAKAESFARAFLASHLDLLAPGAAMGDFRLVANEVRGGLRTLGFRQHVSGMPVLDGKVSFRFEGDRLVLMASTALPDVGVRRPDVLVDAAAARTAARSWIAADLAATPTITALDGPFVLPIYGGSHIRDARAVFRVEVQTASPISRWDVFVDARTGARIAREQTLRFATGTVLYNAPVRRPGAARQDYPAKHADVTIDGQSATADSLGELSFASSPASVSVSAKSAFVQVHNQSGAEAVAMLDLTDGGSTTWDLSTDPMGDAQLSSFIHAQRAKDFAATLAPELSWLDATLPVHVNHDEQCNAYYDGSSINFFRESSQCNNTGRLADVVYHELGHGLHHHAVIAGAGEFEPALSEGVSDYLAATITGDPGMGRGFFHTDAPLRHIDDVDHQWPDDIHQDPHQTGLIIGGALWDLRKNLVEKHGEEAGTALADELFYVAMSNADDIPSMYPEVLAADDDNGNLADGTPNVCEIVDAFGRHGLRTLNTQASSLDVVAPTQDGFQISFHVEGLYEQCASDAVEDAFIEWRTESAPAGTNEIEPLSGGPVDFQGTIPTQDPGSVVRYGVSVDLASAHVPISFPDNPADPMYQFFVGEVTELYCTDFESDPAEEGWTHGLLSGVDEEGADDWQWDVPNGTPVNGDPTEAFSGERVFGNDLGHDNFNGLYQADKVNYADSPIVDVSGHDDIRLQYRRWLQVEDGYYDRARIYANGQLAWDNHASSTEDADTHHTDREWRFHDVSLTPYVQQDEVQIRFEIDTDQGLHMGGWTLDDFCIVAYDGQTDADAVCGNGKVELGEDCDDGNDDPGDGCDASCRTEGAGGTGSGAAPDAGPPLEASGGCACSLPRRRSTPWGALLGVGLAGVMVARRRRR